MAKVKLVGKQSVVYTSKRTGELVEGISVFYEAEQDGDTTEGLYAGNLWVSKGTKLWNQMLVQDLTKPRDANISYDVPPGGRFPILSEISILS